MNYNFPFSTCESNSGNIIAQPYSFIFNLLTSFILLGFSLSTKSLHVKISIFSYFLFELFHSFSHAKHIDKNIQQNIIHCIFYILAFSSLYSILYLSNTNLSQFAKICITICVLFDSISCYSKNTIAMFTSATFLLTIIFITQYDKLPNEFKNTLKYKLIPLLIILWFIIFNESKNCKKMLAWKDFPYHVTNEIIGGILFILLAWNFYKWDATF